MFFDNHQHAFYRENDQYIFINNINPTTMKNVLLTYLNNIILERFERNLYSLDTLYFVTDQCYPHMNWRSNHFRDVVSDEAKKFLRREMLLKYLLKERDIKIDELALNNAFENQFDMFFRDPSEILTSLGANNIIFFRNIFMSENDIFNVIQRIFGKHNVKHQFHYKKDIKHIVNTNDMIYKSKELKDARVPVELDLTCGQIIEIMFSKLFGSDDM